MSIPRLYSMKVLHTQWVINTRRALLGSKGVTTGVALRQRVQQCLRLLQVSRVKPFGKPVIHRGEQVVGFLTFALLLPESSEAGGSTEFPGFCLLALGYTDSLLETECGFGVV